MQLQELMDLTSLDKSQLVSLCNALYELLNQRQAVAPVFTFSPQQPLPFIPLGTYNPPPLYGGTNVGELTQQERFGAR